MLQQRMQAIRKNHWLFGNFRLNFTTFFDNCKWKLFLAELRDKHWFSLGFANFHLSKKKTETSLSFDFQFGSLINLLSKLKPES